MQVLSGMTITRIARRIAMNGKSLRPRFAVADDGPLFSSQTFPRQAPLMKFELRSMVQGMCVCIGKPRRLVQPRGLARLQHRWLLTHLMQRWRPQLLAMCAVVCLRGGHSRDLLLPVSYHLCCQLHNCQFYHHLCKMPGLLPAW